MSKLEDRVNDILGVDTPTTEQKEFNPPVERKEGDKDIDVDYEDKKGINFNCNKLIDIALDEKVRIGRIKNIHDRVISFIEKTKDVFGEYEPMSFGCWKFHLLLNDVFGGEYYYNDNHVITKIDDKFYDINGEVKETNGYLSKEHYPLCFMINRFKKQE